MYGMLPERRLSTRDIVQEGLQYWERIRGPRRMPSRMDLDPVDVPHLLPYVMLIDVLRDPLDFRFRLLGTAHDLIVGGNYRGRRFSELSHTAPGNRIWDEYARVADEGQPLRSVVSYVGADAYVPRQFEHCLMPLSASDRTVDMIFVVAALGRVDFAAGQPGEPLAMADLTVAASGSGLR